ncbi:MAG: HK97 family phage prohead protease [Clostridia bacterium]
MKQKEIRNVESTFLETRSLTEGEKTKLIIEGCVTKYNLRSQLLYNEFYEKVGKGAFSESIKKNNIRALWNHNSDIVLAATESGTLTLEDRDDGLYFGLEFPDTEISKHYYESIKRGDVKGVSFGFYTKEDNWEYLKDEDCYERTLININCSEISITAFPAYEDSSVTTRCMKDAGILTKEMRKQNENIEKIEREKLAIENDMLI